MHFTRLRLIGFKSFVDSTDLLIDPGLTGVVGPNGCGKSNVVEGLRWVMGETSARKLRGREMDDVIFGGSATRPGRNHAEVTILLDNAARSAPSAYNEFSEIEVSRRIERGDGSVYRVNGQEVRARDVQLLFADETTGSRSSALVSQGEIGALIAAKPAQRRSILDEAAGITGLHNRRHEAELRLRAAEGNLERLDDVTGALDTQLKGLRRQARQAKRYRRLNEQLRQAEAMLFHCRWLGAQEQVAAGEAALGAATVRVGGLERAAAAAASEQLEAAAVLPPLREAETEALAGLHRLEVEQVALEAEERRLAEARREVETRRAQADADAERERTLSEDAEAAVTRLDGERTALAAARSGEAGAEDEAAAAREKSAQTLAVLEEEVDGLAARLADEEARRGALTRRLDELGLRIERLKGLAAEIDRESETLAATDDGDGGLGEADAAASAAREAVEVLRTAADGLEGERQAAQAAEAEAREALQEAETRLAAERAEEAALAELLGTSETEEWPAMIDSVSVTAGYETALGAALGDDLTASTETGAPLHWRALSAAGGAPRLPAGAAPLSDFVEAPAALARRLAQVGVVSAADGERLRATLVQGQRLVSREGGLWRWDGFTVAPEAPAPAAQRLRQQNRLAEVRGEIAGHEAGHDAAARAFEAAHTVLGDVGERESAARNDLRRAEEALDGAREARDRVAATASAAASRRSNLGETATRLAQDLQEAEDQRVATLAERNTLPLPEETRGALEAPRADLARRRTELAELEHAHERLRREAAERRQRLSDIDGELEAWRSRAAGTVQRLAEIADRRAAAETAFGSLADRPAEIARERAALFDRLEAAQGTRGGAADAVAEAEGRLAALDHNLRQADAAVAEAREDRVRCEGTHQQAQTTRDQVGREIGERLGCTPSNLAGLAGIEDGQELPDIGEIETRLARYLREREGVGPVNLRADTEATEIEEQLTALRDERADLETAIARLRQAIGRLNREGRERLDVAFREIDEHFTKLFTRLFGGGSAHLSLVDSDDPLEAGLEIMASPPGKRLQILSLLSGGEQALTALALLFAVFLTNPTPICVLDEVDAPLDDANVARFCDMLTEIAHGSSTRFLIVTHHPMTMARMDRLYGVTMSEQGVSRLVSVDLRAAEALRETG